jgi:tripartite-type tricarboxylate transporter receptor subunit TctC
LISRRTGLLGAVSLVASAHRAWSGQPITMLIGAREGSTPDTVARDFTACVQNHFGTIQIGIRNLPGEAGHVMLAALADAPPTGATIGWVATPTLPARMIDRNDATLIQRIQLLGLVEREPVAFVSPASDPVDSVQDIISRAADDADAVPLGTPPAGSPPHLAALRLQALAQTRLNIVTFPSSAAAAQAVLSANVSAAALGLSDVIDNLRDGKLSAIGLAARRRFGLLPDIPILNEAGIPLAASIGRGIAVPAGTPSGLTDALALAMRAVTEDEAFRSQAEAKGYHVMWADGPAWLTQLQAEQADLAKLWATDPWLSSSGG